MKTHILRDKKIKGTVLYTVVSVMMIMIVFVMASLTIASVASKRSYNTYFKDQSLYSARSVVNSTIKGITDTTGANKLREYLSSQLNTVGAQVPLTVVTGGGTDTLPNAMGRVDDLRVEYVGQDTIGTNTFVAGTGAGVIKVSATVEMGGQASTYQKYLLMAPATTTSADVEGGLVTMGGIGGNNNIKTIGQVDSFGSDSLSATPVDETWTFLTNNGEVNGGIYNSSVRVNAQISAVFQKKEGIMVAGHFIMQNIPTFTSTASTSGLLYSEIPHIYSGGVIQKVTTGALTIGSVDHPINIFCGSISGSNYDGMVNFTTYGDVYAYDEYNPTPVSKNYTNGVDNYLLKYIKGLSVFGSSSGTSSLLNWVSGLIQGTDGTLKSYTGGNFFSQGALQITGNGSTFKGDVVVKNDVEINPSAGTGVEISGSLVACNNVEISSPETIPITISKGLFCDPAKLTIATGTVINGIKFDGTKTVIQYLIEINKIVGIVNGSNVNISSLSIIDGAGVPLKINEMDYGATMLAVVNPSNFPVTMQRNYLFTGNGTDDSTKIITSVEERRNQYIEMRTLSDGTTYREYKNYVAKPEGIAADDNVSVPQCYNTVIQADTQNTIASSCTLTGTWSSDITVTAPDSGQERWICLANFSIQNGHNIIVDNTANPTNPGKVCFFVPKHGDQKLYEVTGISATGNVTFTNTKIMTSYYRDATGTIELKLYPDNKEQIPNIYLYVAGGKYSKDGELAREDPAYVSDPSDTAKVTFSNNCMLTGYLYAQYADCEFYQNAVLNASGINYTYEDGTVVSASNEVNVIGKVIVGDLKQAQNNNVVIQVSPNGGGSATPPGGGSSGGEWTELDDSYSFGS